MFNEIYSNDIFLRILNFLSIFFTVRDIYIKFRKKDGPRSRVIAEVIGCKKYGYFNS